MPIFADPAKEIAVKLSATPTHASFDYAPYQAELLALSEREGEAPGYSTWRAMRMGEDDNAKTERKRLSRAANLSEFHVQYHKDSDDKEVWYRLRPAPVPRAKRTLAA